MTHVVVAVWAVDENNIPGRKPIIRNHILVDTRERNAGGKRYYIKHEENAASKTWIDDEKAMNIIIDHL